jgi:hypothetical protein
MEEKITLEEQAQLVWPGIINVIEQSNYIYLSVNSNYSTFAKFHGGLAIIKTDLQCILEFLREKSIQITWNITGVWFDPEHFTPDSIVPKLMLGYVRNGDNLCVETSTNLDRSVGNILETFKGARFGEIRINMPRDDEVLQLVYDTMRTQIYYTENQDWALFEPEI